MLEPDGAGDESWNEDVGVGKDEEREEGELGGDGERKIGMGVKVRRR